MPCSPACPGGRTGPPGRSIEATWTICGRETHVAVPRAGAVACARPPPRPRPRRPASPARARRRRTHAPFPGRARSWRRPADPPPGPARQERRPAPPAAGTTRSGERRIKGQLDPTAELARARQDLETKPERAFLRLALVLRHDPTLAPMVLEALRLRREAPAALLRGDAQRLLGRHLEAEAAYDAAAESLEVP